MAQSWGYKEHNGPKHWGNAFPIACEGKRQSPIDIDSKSVVVDASLEPIAASYDANDVKQIVNTGASFRVDVDGSGSELKGGPLEGRYQLWQYHAHWGSDNGKGSEHTVDGKEFAAELHLVHWNSSKYGSPEEAVTKPDGLAVLGMFITVGGEDHTEFEKIVKMLPDICHKDAKSDPSTPIDPAEFLPRTSRDFWTYEGSLTTPPLAECVMWIVFKDPIVLSQGQLDALRQLKTCKAGKETADDFMVDNFRPPVACGRRVVRTNQA